MIKSIVFDLWETLGTKSIGISKTLREHFRIEKTPDFFQRYEKSIQLKKWKNQKEMAKSFLDAFYIPKNEENIAFVVETLQQGIDNSTLFEGMKDILKRLKVNYSLSILSNTTNFESDILKKWNIERYFIIKVYSYEIGTLKPSKENFNEIIRRLKIKTQECIFIDDGIENVQAAAKYGFKAIQFKNVDQLKKELASFSIKLN